MNKMIKVMVVEDSDDFRKSLCSILAARYPLMELAEAENGDEALRKIDLSPPDLIFVDIHLPGQNGLELTRKIRTLHPNTVIVILSNYDLPEYRETAYKNGANHFIAKDSSMGSFFALVEKMVTLP